MTNTNLSRDELAHLLGASTPSDILATARPDPKKPSRAAATLNKEADVSEMDSKQAAAHVARQFSKRVRQHQQHSATGVKRHRAVKVMQHHSLFEEEKGGEDFETAAAAAVDAMIHDEKEEEEEFVVMAPKRKKMEATVIQRRRGDSSSSSSSSSGSSSSDESSRVRNSSRRRRRDDDDSSDDSVDRRRRRIRERRRGQQQQQEEDKEGRAKKKEDAVSEVSKRREVEPEVKIVELKRNEPMKQQLLEPNREDSDSESSSSSSSSASSCSTSSSSSEEETNQPSQPISKPLFVPKSKRGTIVQQEIEQQKLEASIERKEREKQKRTLQSRALVAEAVAEKSNTVFNTTINTIGDDEEVFLTAEDTDIPDDTDGTTIEEKQYERDAWEVREVLRILAEYDVRCEMEREKMEIRQRRNRTDDEVYSSENRYRRPDEARRKHGNKDDDKKSKYLQRYHHRGAFYMDEDTLNQAGEDDVRHRAAEYSRAATGEDKIDKSMLPEVMQVKKFGFAGYSTKYKGLAKEDTTDRGLDFVPIKKAKRG